MLALHWGACTSLSEPVFWGDGSGGRERRYSKGPRHPRMRGRSETSLDSEPKKEGGKKDSTPDDDDEAPPRLCLGPGPAIDERGYEQKKWEAEGEKAGMRVCPARTHALQRRYRLTDTHTAIHWGRAETNGREEEECVEREDFALTLEKTEGGVCLRVCGG